MLRPRRESLYSNGITDQKSLQRTSATKSAQSGHEDDAKRCLLSKVKRTSGKVAAMSGNDPKRTLDLQDILSAVIQHISPT
jgi:hypothetical protein